MISTSIDYSYFSDNQCILTKSIMYPPLSYSEGDKCFALKTKTLRSPIDLALRKNVIGSYWDGYETEKSIVSFADS